MRSLGVDPGDMDTPLHAPPCPTRTGDAEAAGAGGARARRGDRSRRAGGRRARAARLGSDVRSRGSVASHAAPDRRRSSRPRRVLAARRAPAVVDARGRSHDTARAARLVDFLRPGDLVVANDAATLPASLRRACARAADRRGAARRPQLAHPDGVRALLRRRVRRGRLSHADGGRRRATPARPATARARAAAATVEHVLGHPRLVVAAVRRHGGRGLGRPRAPRPADPVRARADAARAVGRVDAGRRRDRSRSRRPPPASCSTGGRWQALRARGVAFATLTHAAGISSTGDAELDARLPFDEPYSIPPPRRRHPQARHAAVASSRSARRSACARHAAASRLGSAEPRGRARGGDAAHRPATRLRVVDAVLTGAHEPGTSHSRVAARFADDAALRRERRSSARLPHARVRRLGPDRAARRSEAMAAPAPPARELSRART